jgi:hypothetical protein
MIFKAFRKRLAERRAARRQRDLEYRYGGSHVYASEQAEKQERASAIRMPHHQLKAALQIANSVAQPNYRTDPQIIAAVTRFTRLSPASAHRDGTVKYYALEGPGPTSVTTEAEYSYRFTKDYTFELQVSGCRYLLPSTSADQELSPYLGFAYYDRRVETTSNITGAGIDGGVHAYLPQWVLLIHDGKERKRHTRRDPAGFETPYHEDTQKLPARLCMLGEVQGNGDVMAIRRIILDGKQLELTRANTALAMSYAEKLAAQIFAGKDYDPAKALQGARATNPSPGSTGPHV